MSIRKQTRKSREIGMLLSAPQTQCVTPQTSVPFCTGRLAAQIPQGACETYGCSAQDGALGTARPTCNVPNRVRGSDGAARGTFKLRPPGFERIFARASTAKVMLNRGATAVPSDRDWIRSAWLTKRRQSAGPLERDAGGMKASRPSRCQ